MSKAAADQRVGDRSLHSFIPTASLGKSTASAISALPMQAVCGYVRVCVCERVLLKLWGHCGNSPFFWVLNSIPQLFFNSLPWFKVRVRQVVIMDLQEMNVSQCYVL